MSPDDLLNAVEQLPEHPSHFTASLLAASPPRQPSILSAPVRAFGARRRLSRMLMQVGFIPHVTFTANVEALVQIYTDLLTETEQITLALRPIEGLLRRIGAWDDHTARSMTTQRLLNTELNPLRELIGWDATLRAELDAGRLPTDPDFTLSWRSYLLRRGHLGRYALDMACPRFRNTPEVLIPLLLLPQTAPDPSRSLRSRLTLPIWGLARTYLLTRAQIRRYAMRATALIRDNMLTLAGEALPDPDDLWLLDAAEVKRLDDGWRPAADLLDLRRASADTSTPNSRIPQP